MKKQYFSFQRLKTAMNSSVLKQALILCFTAGLYQAALAQSYTFTPCSATGRNGPNQGQVTNAYSGNNLAGLVTVNAGIQTWVVPVTGNYQVRALGARGGGIAGGSGADMAGDFYFTAGTTLNILVGQQGTIVVNTQSTDGASGGGGSYVVAATGSVPLVVAGGGGGNHGTPAASCNGTTTIAGLNGFGPQASGTGGATGVGGTGINNGTGGGGWSGNGGNAANGGTHYGGLSYLNGGTGGWSGNTGGYVWVDGGFGGGGTAVHTGWRGTGGGGGYSGGGSGNATSLSNAHGGGGGGSYNAGTNQVNVAGVNNGDGKVIITKLCNITLSVTGVNSSSAMCAGNSVTLTTDAISNYSWSTGATTSSIVVSPGTTTQYSLTATSPSNCTADAAITVSVNASLPTLTITNTANSGGICPNTTVMLTAAGALTYTWSGGTVPVSNSVAFAPTTAADYTVTGMNGCGTITAVTSVSVHPFPTVNPSASSTTLCAGNSLTLTATGNATNYVWSGGTAPSGNGVGFLPPASTTIYTVIGTSALSCTAQATIPVTVHATPQQAPLASPALICLGGSSTLTAAGATSYTWASSTQTVNTPAFVVTPTGTGVTTYTVIKANSTCSDTKVISVTTNSLPSVFAIATPPSVCALQPSTLSIGGGVSYTWTSPGTPNFTFTGASPIVYPAASTNYTVAASDGTCITITTVSVTANPNPTITTGPSSPSICLGQQVTITAYGANNYTWTSGTNTVYAASITDSPTTAVAYDVTGDNNFGCTASAQQIILVYPLPPTLVSANKTLACSGGSVLLTAGGAHSYTWDANAGGAVSHTAVVYPTNSTSGLVIYIVAGSYTNTGCAFSKTVQVGVYVPTLSVSGTTIACIGGQVSLMASGGNPNTYTWSTGSLNSNFPSLTTTISSAGVFTVSAMSTSLSAMCPGTKTVAVGVHANPVVIATADRTVICPGESTQLFANGGVSYLWSNSQSGGTITISPVAQTNNYTVTGTDANGCVSTGSVQVKLQNCVGIEETAKGHAGLMVYPNPNNGAFTLKGASNLDLVMSNELGQVVRIFALNESNDHTLSVTDLPQGIYFISAPSAGVNFKVVVTK